MKLRQIGAENEANRHRWVIRILKRLPKGSKLLDAGAGEQRYKRFCRHLKYVSQDFGQYINSQDNRGLHTDKWDYGRLDIVSDITKIPVKSDSFDAVLCTEVFEHIPEPVVAVREFHRILKKGGKLIITAPFNSLTHFAPYHFYGGFNIYFYREILPRMGFNIIEVRHNGNYFEYIAQEIRRLPSMAKRYSKTNAVLLLGLTIFILPVLLLMGYFSNRDKGSDEVLCFGYHVLAEKK
jgi:ubiquinone/menaquinone biosynthesis C-methylase UbiE